MSGDTGVTSPAVLVACVLGCVAASAFLSFSETCLTALPAARVHALMASGGRRARVLELWLKEPHAVLVTILVGNTLANIVATALLTRVASRLWGELGVSCAIGVMTLAILTFGEIGPKAVARQHAAAAAIPTLLVLRVVHHALLPATWALQRAARLALRLFADRTSADRDVTEAEIEALIDLGRREGSLAPAKARALSGVFGLSERTVREVMVPRTDLFALDLDLPAEEVIRRADASGLSRIPVHRGRVDEIVGVLHAKDLAHLLLARGGAPSNDEIAALLREPLIVPESMRLDTLLRTFRRSRQHLAVVLDEYGGTAGIVTLEDVLEELVGEIRDEHDEESPLLMPRGAGSFTADGRVSRAVLEERVGLELPSDAPYDTLGGLLMDLAGRVPRGGEVFRHGSFRLEVLSGGPTRVGLVRITREAEPAGEAGGGEDQAGR